MEKLEGGATIPTMIMTKEEESGQEELYQEHGGRKRKHLYMTNIPKSSSEAPHLPRLHPRKITASSTIPT